MKKRLIILITILIVLSLGVTYAIFKWTSSNSDVTFNVEGCYITYDAGSNISGASFGPALTKDDTTNVISKKITMTPECSGVTANLTLTVDSIDDGLKEESFIYELYSGSNKVSSGNFKEATNGKVYTILNTKTLTENVTDTYTLYIYIDGNMDNPTTMGGKSFSFTLGASGENAILSLFPANAVTLVNSLDDGTTGDSGSGVYKVTHSAIASGSSATGSEIPASTDYRYYGASPNNYICLDMEGSSTCPDKHLYRIIGSIYEEKENANRIKVIKATPLTDGTTKNFSWDYTSSGSYSNIWATVTSGNYSNSLTSGSQLMKLLNSGLWWNGTSTNYYSYSYDNRSITATTVNFTDYKLSDKAKSYITISRYYLGGYTKNELTNYMYGYERGTNRYDTNRPLYWDGMVGLMYLSDYGYAAGDSCATGTSFSSYKRECIYKDWLYLSNAYQWVMTPCSDEARRVFNITSDGGVVYNYSRDTSAVNPVFYLTSTTTISSGDGTSSNPYIASK